MEVDLLDVGLRTHEILENALQFQLTGHDDYGSGTTLATTAANITGTRELLTILHPHPGQPVPGPARRLHLAGPAAAPARRPGSPRPAGRRSASSAPPAGSRSTRPPASRCRSSPRSPSSPSRGGPDERQAPDRSAAAFLRGALRRGCRRGRRCRVRARLGRLGIGQQRRLRRHGQRARPSRLAAVPFHGVHQAGILPAPQRQTAVVVLRRHRRQPQRADRPAAHAHRPGPVPDQRAAPPPPTGITAPPSDSGVLGPTVAPDGLTVTVGVGASLFDDRYGLAAPQAGPADADAAVPRTTPSTRRSATATSACSSAPGTPTPCCTRCGTSPSTPAAGCRSGGASTASRARRARGHDAAQPAGLHGRHRQPRRHGTPR